MHLCVSCALPEVSYHKKSVSFQLLHMRERFNGGLLAEKAEGKVWESEKISGQVLYSGRFPSRIVGVNNFLHLLSHVVTFLMTQQAFFSQLLSSVEVSLNSCDQRQAVPAVQGAAGFPMTLKKNQALQRKG